MLIPPEGWKQSAHVTDGYAKSMWLPWPACSQSWTCQQPECPGKLLRHVLNAATILALTVPGNILNASLCNSSILFMGGMGISGILLYCSWTLSKIALLFFQQSG